MPQRLAVTHRPNKPLHKPDSRPIAAPSPSPHQADYALLADYRMRPAVGRAWTVHFVIRDRDGEWVIVDYQNNHHDDFQSIDPKTTDDCGRLVAKRLVGYLR